MALPAAVGAGINLLGGIFGSNAQDKAAAAAQKRYEDLLRTLEGLPGYEYIQGEAPTFYDLPEEMQASLISEDPQLRETELKALQGLKSRAEEGMTAADTADWMAKQGQAATEARGQEEAIMDAMSRRGMGGGGTEYALRMGAQQNALDRLAQNEAAKAASNAELRALAELKGGQMAGQMRGEDFNVASTNADILNQFTQANSIARERAKEMNTQLQNAYAQNEVEERRNVQRGNVGLGLEKARTQAGIAGGQNANDLARSVGKSNLYSEIGKQAGNAINYLASDDKNRRWGIW